jgi:hypothetical protein
MTCPRRKTETNWDAETYWGRYTMRKKREESNDDADD